MVSLRTMVVFDTQILCELSALNTQKLQVLENVHSLEWHGK